MLRMLIYLVIPVTIVLGFCQSVASLTRRARMIGAGEPGGSGGCVD